MQPGRQQAHAELAAIQRSAMAAKVGKARAKAADTRAARLAQQNGGIAVSCTAQLFLHTCCLMPRALLLRACAWIAPAC